MWCSVTAPRTGGLEVDDVVADVLLVDVAFKVLGDMKRKLSILYHFTDTVSGLKSAKLTCAQPCNVT